MKEIKYLFGFIGGAISIVLLMLVLDKLFMWIMEISKPHDMVTMFILVAISFGFCGWAVTLPVRK